MNEELVENLRDASQYMTGIVSTLKNWVPIPTLLIEAANTIEELSKKVDEWQEEACKWNNEYYYLLDNTPRWIPVTDHTPKYNGYYIVCDNDNDVFTAYFGNTTKNWWTEKTVTHWMPRPEPPKEET